MAKTPQNRPLRLIPLGGAVGLMSAARAFANAEKIDNGDGTFDLLGVEILSVGGPIHGVGSPPEGDFWSLDELRAMAEADAELGDELLPPNKIGHPDEQTLVRNSIDAGELPEPADGELPAVGWLENLRVDGQKLLADVKKVPTLVVDLIEKGAYRTRSVELAKVTSQRSGKTYDWVVSGLAWLGGKLPAVKTLGDVAALYSGDVPIRRVFVETREYAVGDVVWNPRRSLQGLRDALQETLNGPASGGFVDPRWYVRDVSIDYRAIVEDWAAVSVSELDAYVVAFTVADDGTVGVAPAAEWTPAEPTWIEAAKDYEERALTIRASRADTGPMRYTAKQRRVFAEATGLDESNVTDKMLEDAGVAPATDDPAPEPTPDPAPEPDPPVEPQASAEGDDEEPEGDRALEARVVAVETELHQERRKAFVDAAIRSGKIAPGQRKSVETLYDRGADEARAFIDELEPRQELLDELGADGEEDDERDLEEGDRSYAEEASGRLGISKDKLV